jgi:hypothetical protein
MTAPAMEMHTAGEPFLLVRFLCGSSKKMNPVVGPGPDDLDCFYSNIKPFKLSGLSPTILFKLHGFYHFQNLAVKSKQTSLLMVRQCCLAK